MSNKTPKVADVKTKLAPKARRFIGYGILLALAFFALLAGTLFYTPAHAELQVNDKTVSLEIASTAEAQAKGLGGRESVAANSGMLFVFAKPVAACLWMKGMEFPLDMVWLNTTKQVVYIQQNVLPSTYPKNFCPSLPASYVIELNAGQVQALGITTGQTLNF
jgi:uncharacterized membrane protein (UPF0127 family)